VTQPKVSVVVPTYNRAALLARTLDSLVAQRFPAEDLEVVVADDGSSDHTAGVARSYAQRLRLHYHFQEDLGFRAAAARNAGARLATGQILVFLDTGGLAGPDCVRAHLDAHHERVAVMGYLYGYTTFEPDPVFDQEILSLEPAAIVERLGHDRRFLDPRHSVFELVDFDVGRLTAAWYQFWSANISIRTEDYWAIGGFDEDFHGWGAEDLEIGYRLLAHGIPIVLSRDAWSVELPHDRGVANVATSLRNMQRVLDKHQDPAVELCVFVLFGRRPVTIEDATRLLVSWTRRCRSFDVLPELETATSATSAAPPPLPPRRVAVFGCGGAVPASWATDGSSYTLLDFDRELLDRACGSGPYSRYHGIGLRTSLPDKGFDLVIITSRLRGLWDRWGKNLLQEANRIGRAVRVPFRSPGSGSLPPTPAGRDERRERHDPVR
jgi:GT2 family glycosyltransferase